MADLPEVDRARLAWWAVGAVLGAALVLVVYSFIGTFVFAVFIYYATRPVYRRLKHRFGPPSLAAAVALFLISLPILSLVGYTTAVGLQELSNVLEQYELTSSGSLGEIEKAIQPYLDVSSIIDHPQQLLNDNDLAAVARQTLGSALEYVGFVGTALLHLFVMIAVAFYLLRDDHRLSRWFIRRFGDDRGVLAGYVRAVDQDFNNIFFGNILNAFITAIIGAVAYNALAVFAPGGATLPYPTLLGLLTGAASLIPVVGMKLVYVPVTVYLLGQAALAGPATLFFAALFFGVSFVIVDSIPDLVLRPYVSGRNLHVGMVMFAYIFGPLLFGWYGIFLGPMILVLAVHFGNIVLPELLAGQPIQPWAVDPSHMVDVRESPEVSVETEPDAEPAESSGERAEPDADEPDETVPESAPED
jgi:predicted PurR-regulated permease PerM